jgi:sugar O-acyltransferase (sialic acid O-acetyltransferase NeuD family)
MVDVLIGTGSHSRDIQAVAERCGRKLSVLDETVLRSFPWGGAGPAVLIAVNDPQTRQQVAQRWPHAADSLIDPAAIVNPDSEIDIGCVIAPNAILLREATLGQHVHINYASTLTRCSVGAFTTIAPGVTICGDVEIGEAVFIGAGATICNLLKIGDGATIAAGAVVIHDVPAGETVRGVPAT